MARRKPVEAPTRSLAAGEGGLPPELAVGRLIEVWASDERPAYPIAGLPHGAYSAWRRWSAALSAFLEGEGLTTGRGFIDWRAARARFGRIPNGAPWSIAFLDKQGRAAEVDERLARAGVRREDLPDLRHRALG